jgi:hypothetical protein
MKKHNLTKLWDMFGIVGDVVVSVRLLHPVNVADVLQPFTHHFPRADIHQMLAFDLLHQVIKGTFKDHLVTWVEEYLVEHYGKAHANRIMDDIDCW